MKDVRGGNDPRSAPCPSEERRSLGASAARRKSRRKARAAFLPAGRNLPTGYREVCFARASKWLPACPLLADRAGKAQAKVSERRAGSA